jgi:hypothetical protein
MPLIDRALKCVVFIGGVSDPGGFSPTFVPYGTGFVFSVFHEEIRFDYIVTCHHVINSIPGDNIWIRLNLKDGKSTSVAVPKNSWLFDPKQDIAVLSQEIGELADVLHIIDKDVLTKEVLKDLSEHYRPVVPTELTFLVGLFTSHYGTMHNIPIARMGNIAAMPDDLVFTDTGYIRAYLIETRSIGGLSGSPVFLSRVSYLPVTEDALAILFFGMMRGRLNTQDANDVVAGDSPADTINSGIGVVVPSEDIMKFINKPEFVDQREKTVQQLKKKSHFRPTVAIPKTDNPRHKEDFNSLLTAAAKKKPPVDET